MEDAEKNGFAEDDVKDYNYWCKLFNEIFRSNARLCPKQYFSQAVKFLPTP